MVKNPDLRAGGSAGKAQAFDDLFGDNDLG
jgi:hypothetical protein